MPEGARRVAITAWGAGGGGSVALATERVPVGYAGGAGGVAVVELEVTPGEPLLIVPGRGGLAGGALGPGAWTWQGEAGGVTGGGPGAPVAGEALPFLIGGEEDLPGCRPLSADAAWLCTGAGAGGGFSGVFAGAALTDLRPEAARVIAGGGGGAGAGGDGGAGGGVSGEDAPACGLAGVSFAGPGGGPDAPGGRGVRATTLEAAGGLGTLGGALRGGSGGYANAHLGLSAGAGATRGGGGGGAGWYGGGGGAVALPGQPGCGGGGGSGYAPDGRLGVGDAPDLPAAAGEVWGAGGAPGEDGGHGGVRIQW